MTQLLETLAKKVSAETTLESSLNQYYRGIVQHLRTFGKDEDVANLKNYARELETGTNHFAQEIAANVPGNPTLPLAFRTYNLGLAEMLQNYARNSDWSGLRSCTKELETWPAHFTPALIAQTTGTRTGGAAGATT